MAAATSSPRSSRTLTSPVQSVPPRRRTVAVATKFRLHRQFEEVDGEPDGGAPRRRRELRTGPKRRRRGDGR